MAVLAPAGLTATGVALQQINLAWTNHDEYDHVLVYRKGVSGSYALVQTLGDVESWNNTGLTPGTYFYYVKGTIDGVGTSPASNIAEGTCSIDPPTSLAATGYDTTRIDLAWNIPGSYDATHDILIERKEEGGDYSQIDTVAGTATSYSDSGLSNYKKYYYRIRGKTNIGHTWPNLLSPYTAASSAWTLPDTPTGLRAEVNSPTSIYLNWDPITQRYFGARIFASIKIERKTGSSGTYAVIASIDGDHGNFGDGTCANGFKYYYRIRGRTAAGVYSAYSTAASATTGFAAPSGCNAQADSDTQATVTWVDNSQGETGFEIFMKSPGGPWLSIHETAANATSYVKTGLTASCLYGFKVRAIKSSPTWIYSEFSNEAFVFMDDPPAKPSLLTAVATATTKVQLSWHDNSDNETGFKVERSATSAVTGFSLIATLGANVKGYEDTGRTTNTQYWYRVQSYNGSGGSGYTNVATAMTWADITAPTNLALTAAKVGGAYGVEVTFDDNSSLEDSHIIERTAAGAVEALTDGGLENWASATNLTSWTESVSGTSTINREATTKHGGTYACRFDVDASNSACYIYQALTLTAGGLCELSLWYKTAAGKSLRVTVYDSGSNVFLQADGTWGAQYLHVLSSATWAQYTLPFTAHASYTAYLIQITRHNAASSSLYVDDVSITGTASDYAELVTLAPNRTYYHDATAAAGTTYAYRVRAKQGASTYSAYCNSASIAVPDVPATPADLAVSEYQDTWARLAWTPVAGAVGYSIEQSDDNEANYAEVMRIGVAEAASIKITGLAASTHYHWKMRAYSAAGNSSYSTDVSQTVRAAYLPSKFDKLIRKSKPKLINLIEANPLMELTGWTLVTGLSYTYETPFDEDGVAIDALYENGAALTAKASITEVSVTAGTYWHDTAAKKVYVRLTDGGDPINAFVAASFWVYLTTWQRGATVYNGNNYLPLIPAGGIPDISQAIQPYYEGTFAVSSGTIEPINGKVRKAFHFDTRFSRYLWLNRKVRALAGGVNFTYAEFQVINTGLVNSVGITDQRLSLDLRDAREGLHCDLPLERYSLDEFPLMDTNSKARERPYGFGAVTNAVPVLIDTVNKVYEFHRGRVKAVSATMNGAALSENTDFFVDYANGRLKLARGLAYADADILLVSFTGHVNIADEALVTGAEIFLYICTTWLGQALSDMDLDAIYRTKYAAPTALSLYLRKLQSSQDVIRTVEQSCQSYTMQDAEGRLGIHAEQTAPASGAPYVWNCQVFDFEAHKGQEQLYSAINVYYGEDPSSDIFSLDQTLRPTITWKHGVNKTLDLYVALPSASDAAALGTAIADMMERPQVSFTVPRVLYTCLPGDVIWFTRTRFPSLSGTAANLPIRILGISKLISSGKTEITAEVVQ